MRREPLLFVLVAFAAVVYAVYAIWEHNHFQTDYDLAIFDQAIWHYSRLEVPESSVRGFPNLLGDHFHPILILLGPLYWFWADPRMLLVVQAIAIAASFVPVFLYARPRVGRVGAYALAGAYGLFWSISAAVGYQFHELAFAPLLIACCILFADRRQWRAYFVSLALLLLVKENMSMVVCFLGVWVMVAHREWRRGLITSGAGLAYYVLVVNVLIPLFSGGRDFMYWTYHTFGPDLPAALRTIAGNPALFFHELIDDPIKTRTIAYLLVPFLALILWSPLIIVAVPLVLQQLLSDSPLFWGRDFHHWLPIAPVLAMGAADGLRNLLRVLDIERWAPWVGAGLAAVMLYANFEIAQRFPLWQMTKDGFSLKQAQVERQRKQALDSVPRNASLTTQAYLLPHASHRDELYLLGYKAPTTEYVVYNPAGLGWPDPAFAQRWLDHRRSRYRQVLATGDVVVLKRRD